MSRAMMAAIERWGDWCLRNPREPAAFLPGEWTIEHVEYERIVDAGWVVFDRMDWDEFRGHHAATALAMIAAAEGWS